MPRGKYFERTVFWCLYGYQGRDAGYFERVINDKAMFISFKDDKELFTEDLAYLHNLLQVGKIDPKNFGRGQ